MIGGGGGTGDGGRPAPAARAPATVRELPATDSTTPPAMPEPATQAVPADDPKTVLSAQPGELWARILRAPDMPTVLRTILTNLRPVSYDGAAGRIVISGASRYADSARARMALVVDACRKVLGRSIEVVVQSDDVPGDESPAEPGARAIATPPARPEGVQEQTPDPASEPPAHPGQHPLVREAMELFGARIVDIQQRRPSAPPPPSAQPNPQGP